MPHRKRFEFDREAPALIASSIRDEILRKTQDDGVTPLAGAKLIARERIRPDPGQPRRHFDRAALLSLAASLLADGMQAPITAYYDDDEDVFTILTGERRWRAAGIAEIERVPVLVQPRPADPADTLGKQLAENLLREDLTELEKAQALARLRAMQPQTWQELARRHGLSDRRLYQMLSLIDAPEPLQIAIQDRPDQRTPRPRTGPNAGRAADGAAAARRCRRDVRQGYRGVGAHAAARARRDGR